HIGRVLPTARAGPIAPIVSPGNDRPGGLGGGEGGAVVSPGNAPARAHAGALPPDHDTGQLGRGPEGPIMSIRLAVDRFEGRDKQLAVLVADDGRTVVVPRTLLPTGSRGGEVLRVTLTPA